MALYEYVCRDCDTAFDLRRAMGDADRSVACPNGHTNVRRKLSIFAAAGSAGPAPLGSAPSAGGGCCGGSCGCAH